LNVCTEQKPGVIFCQALVRGLQDFNVGHLAGFVAEFDGFVAEFTVFDFYKFAEIKIQFG